MKIENKIRSGLDFKSHVLQNIKLARKSTDLSQADLAKSINVAQRKISQVESGGVALDLKTIFNIAERLDLPPFILKGTLPKSATLSSVRS